jgi:hypothetical protein
VTAVAYASDGSGMTLDGLRRSLMLKVSVTKIGLERVRGLLGAKALVEQLPELAAKAAGSPEAEATVTHIKAELEDALAAELESSRLEQKSALKMDTLDGGFALEGKALRDSEGKWPSEKAREFTRFIKRIGGFSADGAPAIHPLDHDPPHVERAISLIYGEAAPDSADERKALASWRAKYGGGE